MKKKIGKVLHWTYISGLYVFGIFLINKLDLPAYVYPLWTITYTAGYVAHDLEHGEWPGDEEERK